MVRRYLIALASAVVLAILVAVVANLPEVWTTFVCTNGAGDPGPPMDWSPQQMSEANCQAWMNTFLVLFRWLVAHIQFVIICALLAITLAHVSHNMNNGLRGRPRY